MYLAIKWSCVVPLLDVACRKKIYGTLTGDMTSETAYKVALKAIENEKSQKIIAFIQTVAYNIP